MLKIHVVEQLAVSWARIIIPLAENLKIIKHVSAPVSLRCARVLIRVDTFLILTSFYRTQFMSNP